ncbi:recombination protein O N-terminal domain-containing protein [Sphingomonas sp. LHG3406-1]|uniref:DNA repair protein RecO n=1 Tax=Sphingomonas sp. LHG3406-1 TaxID=2804617 RepID=UPI0026130771|nr:recombination protein O N-terminal domain-containing protein [Sphingomonas sp. LHG3406-1]
MRLTTSAIILSLRIHGETGAVVRMLTPVHGLVAAYVRGARGRRMRPVLLAGNVVEARLAARTEAQLPQAEVELTRSRAPLMTEPLPAAGILWATTLVAEVLPERSPYPALYQGLDGLLDAIAAAPSAKGWGPALLAFELLLLAELGFGLDHSMERTAMEDWPAGLDLTGRRIRRDLLQRPGDPAWDARERLTGRLRRAVGLVA